MTTTTTDKQMNLRSIICSSFILFFSCISTQTPIEDHTIAIINIHTVHCTTFIQMHWNGKFSSGVCVRLCMWRSQESKGPECVFSQITKVFPDISCIVCVCMLAFDEKSAATQFKHCRREGQVKLMNATYRTIISIKCNWVDEFISSNIKRVHSLVEDVET